jgi:SAM-dependent methyltransferase
VSAGDVDYERYGPGYAARRRTDPRIAALLHAALGDARLVLNVGAGAGSYEPPDRRVLAVEPSAAMRAQRPAAGAGGSWLVAAVAAALPLRDSAVDAAMATVTVHQWPDPAAGLREVRRVTRGPVAVLTFDPAAVGGFWLAAYAPELAAVDARRMPPLPLLADALGGTVTVLPVPIPFDCTDGVTEAYYGRPEALLDPGVRRAQSGWSFLGPGVEDRAVAALAADLASGAWDARWGGLRTQPAYLGSLRLLVANR